MEQTFDDLLEGEPTSRGRLMIWARALLDLPSSAAKEHVTNGKGIIMNRATKLILLGSIIAVIVIGLGSFWAGSLHAKGAMGVERVSVVQLADAMQQDHFYSDYGDSAVLFTAKVSKVDAKDDTSLVTFATGRPYDVVCQFTNISVHTGQAVSVVAPAGSADRQPHGVLLHNCLQN